MQREYKTMNCRLLPCGGKEVISVGETGTFADMKAKLNICLKCQGVYNCHKPLIEVLTGMLSAVNRCEELKKRI